MDLVKSANFKELQKHWYQRLKENGFRDIENLDGTLKQVASTADRDYKGVERESREEYFRRLGLEVHERTRYFRSVRRHFKDFIDQHILSRHAEGIPIKQITEELTDMGVSRTRHTVRFIIRRYVMEWNIKTFTKKQLDKE